MFGLFIGYARVSTEEQDLTAQRNGLPELGVKDEVEVERIYVDHGLTGTNRDRPAALSAVDDCPSAMRYGRGAALLPEL